MFGADAYTVPEGGMVTVTVRHHAPWSFPDDAEDRSTQEKHCR